VTEAEAQVKGASFVGTLEFIEARFGGPARDRVLKRLSPEDRALVGGLLLPIGMYPLSAFINLLRATEDELGSGDCALLTERGSWVAMKDIRTTHKLVMKFMSPAWIIQKGAGLWKNFHTSGRWEASPDGTHGARAVLYDIAIVDAALCATLKGWIIGMLTVGGCKHLKVVHTECRTRGAPACVYLASWS
jgi:hypothetical protein